MKAKLLLFVLLTFVSLNYRAQVNFSWATGEGSAGNDYGLSVVVDASDNVITTGYFTGTVDFDPGGGVSNFSSLGVGDVFISKLDVAGNFVWTKQIGSVADDRGYSVAVDAAGDIYLTGFFASTTDFDPNGGVFNLTSLGSKDAFVCKLDASGNFVWAKQFGGSTVEHGYTIAVDGNGDVYTTGIFNGNADFDPGAGSTFLTTAGNYDVYVSKLNALGNFVWAKQMGGAGIEAVYSLVLDTASNVYTTGSYNGTADFDPSGTVYNLSGAVTDIFISKLDSAGNFVWAKGIGNSTGSDEGYSIAVDSALNVYTTGYYNGTTDFDPSGGIYYLTSTSSDDIFISKLDAAGNFVWAKSMGGPSSEVAFDIELDRSGNGDFYLTGYYKGTADFDPSAATVYLSSVGGTEDIYITKFDSAGSLIWAKSTGGAGNEDGHCIALGANNTIFITGWYTGTCDFDLSASSFNLTAVGGIDIFNLKLCQMPIPTISAGGSTTFCQGDSVVLTSSAGANYLWGFGAITQNVTFTTTGMDSVTVTDVNGCSSTSSILSYTAIPSTDVVGHVSYSLGSVTSGDVVAYKYIPSYTYFDTVQIASLDGLGNYIFTGLNAADYIIKVFADPLTYPTLNPTYYGNEWAWDSATVFVHGCSMIDSANVVMIQEIGTGTGPGMLTGTMVEGVGFGSALMAQNGFMRLPGEPIPGIDVKLGKNPGGAMVASGTTGPTGVFTFTGVDLNGTTDFYTVYVDIPGLERDSSYNVTLTSTNNQIYYLDYYVDSTTIFIVPNAGVGISNPDVAEENKFGVYPNPSNGNSSIEYTLENATSVSLSIYNVLGENISQLVNTNQKAGVYKYSTNDLNLVSGIYFITLITDGKASTQRLIITE